MPVYQDYHIEEKTVKRVEQYVPALFIGLGGTGKDVLMRLRRRLYDASGPAARPYLRYLMIDTDSAQWWPVDEPQADYEPVRPAPGETVDCQIRDNDLARVFQLMDQQHDPMYTGWLKPSLRHYHNAIKQGAGTIRPFGRIAFMLKHQVIRSRIAEHLTSMLADVATLDPRMLPNVTIQPSTVEVVIITSLAGGTGSGMFLDVAYLVRDIFMSHDRLRNLTTKYTTLIATMPTVYQSKTEASTFPKLQQNGYAALLELEHYGTVRTSDDMFLGPRKERRGDRSISSSSSSDNRSSVGFVAPWKEKERQFIPGQGWDSCFLIDNVNPLREHPGFTPKETCQMIADYLFLDFQQSEFAIRKRSTRANLAQYRLDHNFAYVKSLAVASELGETVLRGMDVVYATRSGRAFSSFGLAEISFSRERVYRAAGYLLAARLVAERWKGNAASRQPTEYQEDAKADFYKPPMNEFSFLPEDMLRAVYYDPPKNKNWYEDAVTECNAAKTAYHFTQGLEQLQGLRQRHAACLREPQGEAARTARERTNVLIGNADILGIPRERIRKMARERANTFGVAVTRQLLATYRELAEYLSKLATQPGRWDKTAMARLVEANELYAPARTLGQKNTFDGACDATKAEIIDGYRGTAARHVHRVITKVREYIGKRGEGRPADLDRHGTLTDYFQEAETQLGKIGDQLQQRFREFSRQDDSDRCQILSPNWTEQNYYDILMAALGACTIVNPNSSPRFEWALLEEQVFNELREENPQEYRSLASLTDLLDYWFDRRMTGEDAVKTIAETLANACRRFLTQRVGLNLSEYHNGCVTELLEVSCRADERRRRLEKLVRSSAPFLPLSTPAELDPRGRPKFSNLIGAKCPNNIPGAVQRQTSVMGEMAALAQNENADLGQPEPQPAEESSLLVCREVWGIPLQFYSYLNSLHEAYMERVSQNTADECHINYNETWEDLPDPRPIHPDRYEQIEYNVEHAIFARMIGKIRSERQDDRTSYFVRVPGHVGFVDIRLGSRIGRILMKACEDDRIWQYLRRVRNEWEDEAEKQPKKWALVYASALMTLDSTQADFSDPKTISPLRNCMTAMVKNFQRQLSATDEGQRWLAYLRLPTEDRQELKDAWNALYAKIVNDWKILVCESAQVPIYEVNEAAAEHLKLPDA